MSDSQMILTESDERGVHSITLNRPDVHNAFDDQLIVELISAFSSAGKNDEVRVIILRGEGKSFSAGADLNWMRRMAGYTEEENLKDAGVLADLLSEIAFCPKPVIARVHGTAMGGGVGLIAACDIAIGSSNARFALSEVKLGLIPSVISPYVIRAIGERQASRYMISGERFDALEAERIGLLHQRVDPEELDNAVETFISELLKNGPSAMAETKSLIAAVVNRPLDGKIKQETAIRIARVRASEEGKEGLNAFLNKRQPGWLREGS